MLRLRTALTPEFLFPQAEYPKTTKILNLGFFGFQSQNHFTPNIFKEDSISYLMSGSNQSVLTAGDRLKECLYCRPSPPSGSMCLCDGQCPVPLKSKEYLPLVSEHHAEVYAEIQGSF